MLRAARVKGRTASRATVSPAEILCNRKCLLTVATKNCVGLAFILAPDRWRMTGQLFMTLYAGIKCVAALESHSHNIKFRVVVLTLSSLIDRDAADYHLTRVRSVTATVKRRINQRPSTVACALLAARSRPLSELAASRLGLSAGFRPANSLNKWSKNADKQDAQRDPEIAEEKIQRYKEPNDTGQGDGPAPNSQQAATILVDLIPVRLGNERLCNTNAVEAIHANLPINQWQGDTKRDKTGNNKSRGREELILSAHRPNENKISHRWLSRALLEMNVC